VVEVVEVVEVVVVVAGVVVVDVILMVDVMAMVAIVLWWSMTAGPLVMVVIEVMFAMFGR